MTILQRAIESARGRLEAAEYNMEHSNGDENTLKRKAAKVEMARFILEVLLRERGNTPLTIEELRRMDGDPVWIVEYPDWGHWELSTDAADYISDRTIEFYGMMHDDPAGKYGLHALGWLAYRNRPEEEKK